MKRIGELFEEILTDENLGRALKDVCDSHRWDHYPDKPNRVVQWIEATFEARIEELRFIIISGFEPTPAKKKRRYDANAGKWRDISEPILFPDQCVHHALIQVLEPIFMRGMDHYCCGSIKKRGAHYGIRAMKGWMRSGKGMKWCLEADIRHFYDSLKPSVVMARMRELIKDYRTLDLIERIIRDGVLIGAYCSQWFANTVLQPLDQLIRENGAERSIRYMDNFTVFAGRKRTVQRVLEAMRRWLSEHGLALKENWQIFRTAKRLPNALGYRFGRGYTLLRKKSLLRLKRQLRKFYWMRSRGRRIPVKFAQGLLSRLGMLRHCNSVGLYRRFVRKHTQRYLKDIVREYYRKEKEKWTISLDTLPKTA